MNEAGLFTGTTALFLPGPDLALPAPVGWFIGRHILDHCATGSGARLIADRSGDAVVMESSVEGREIRCPEDGLLILTNHAACAAFAGQDRDSAGYAGSHARYNRLQELLGGAKAVDVDMVKDAMTDHKSGICSHYVDSSGRKMSTIGSVVARPGAREISVAGGHPCRAEYRTVHFTARA